MYTIILYYYFTPLKNVDNIDTICEYVQIYKKLLFTFKWYKI